MCFRIRIMLFGPRCCAQATLDAECGWVSRSRNVRHIVGQQRLCGNANFVSGSTLGCAGMEMAFPIYEYRLQMRSTTDSAAVVSIRYHIVCNKYALRAQRSATRFCVNCIRITHLHSFRRLRCTPETRLDSFRQTRAPRCRRQSGVQHNKWVDAIGMKSYVERRWMVRMRPNILEKVIEWAVSPSFSSNGFGWWIFFEIFYLM